MMDAAVQMTGKKVVKVLGAACLAAGVAALGAIVNRKYSKAKGE